MSVKKFSLISFLSIILFSCTSRIPPGKTPDIIPVPFISELKEGYFKVNGKTKIVINSPDADVQMVADGLKGKLALATGKTIAVSTISGEQPKHSIYLKIDRSVEQVVGEEGYVLSVKTSQIEIKAPAAAGLFYGVQTLYQLLPAAIYTSPDSLAEADVDMKIPCIEVTDKPAFKWRGMHLDVSRHFFPKEFIKQYIDLIAMHKMNTFHWHLTDDNGWRIQIDRYPLLTEVCAWRADRKDIPWNDCQPQRPGEQATYGGFYTKDDIREIVEYARQRFVTIIPEIEMPGHTSEVFAAYPEYSCSGKKIPVQTGSYWPNTDIFCAGKEGTFEFIENVLDEVIELFPSEYIHIGGDEADKTAWKSCPDDQARMRKEGLSGVDELQSYFVKRIEKYLYSKGRKMIGWDEILDGGVAPGASIMSWRGYEGGISAAKQGHHVVMCPTSHCYFDYYQADPAFQPKAIGGLTYLKKVYSFNPIPSELNPNEATLILGAQGNLWTEFISTPDHLEYMALPRMTALAEVLWSPKYQLVWDSFHKRLKKQFERFDCMHVNYCDGSGKVNAIPRIGSDNMPYSIKLETEAQGTDIYYTLDGSEPGTNSAKYEKPFAIGQNAQLKAIAYKGDEKLEKTAEYNIDYHKAVGMNLIYRKPFSERYAGAETHPLNDGLRGSLNYNDGFWQGFLGNDMDVVVEFGQDLTMNSISTTFLLDQKKWIFIPQKVNYYISQDGQNYQLVASISHKIDLKNEGVLTNDFSAKFGRPLKARAIRVEAVNIGVCPEWHPGKGQNAWLFADEIVVK